MDKDNSMKNKILAISVAALAQAACADRSPIMQYSGDSAAALEFITTATNYWGSDAASAEGVFRGVYGVLRYAIADCDQSELASFFCTWAELAIPPAADRTGTNTWLRVKCVGLNALAGSRAVLNDTNCWLAAAREYGRIADIDRFKWYELLDIDRSLIDERDDGTVAIDAPAEKRAALGGKPWMTIGTNGITYVNAPYGAGLDPDGNDAARDVKAQLDRRRHDLRHIIGEFVSSDRFAEMDAPTRSAIVSNIVESAHFTAEESMEIGLAHID